LNAFEIFDHTPLQHGELLHKSRMAVFPHHTRANECCQLAGHGLAGLSQGRSRITERSPVTGFCQTSPILWVCDPARRSGRGATFAPKSRIGDVWSATLPQSDKGRVARHSGAIERGLARTGGEEFTSTSTRGSVQNRCASSTLTNGASRLLASRDGIKSRNVLTYASAKTMFAS
jgi:hypothetical protein